MFLINRGAKIGNNIRNLRVQGGWHLR